MYPEVSVIQVVQVKFVRGRGTEENPTRLVTGYWSMDGELLADNDCFNKELISKYVEQEAQSV